MEEEAFLLWKSTAEHTYTSLSAEEAEEMERSLTLLVTGTSVTARPDVVLQEIEEMETLAVAMQRRVTPPPSAISNGFGSLGVIVTSSGVKATRMINTCQ